MKTKYISLTTVLLLFMLVSFGQTKGILYKADKWLDIKGKGGWAEAMKDPTNEKVEILRTDKNIKVTFGTKVYNYKIVSSSIFSEVSTIYNVSLNGKNYVIAISSIGTTGIISIDGTWLVYDISDISTVDIK